MGTNDILEIIAASLGLAVVIGLNIRIKYIEEMLELHQKRIDGLLEIVKALAELLENAVGDKTDED